jgi:hypothetical protein
MKPLNRSSIKNNQLVLAFVDFVNSRASFSVEHLFLTFMKDRIGACLSQSVQQQATDWIFLYSTASRPDLRTIQPLIQWVPGTLSHGIKRQRRDADYSPTSNAEVKSGGARLHSPIRLHGVLLN